MKNVKIIAPVDSPNTDGIKIGDSNRISIFKITIATGDDCIAIISGASNINISRVMCGPGHGISIGSLGKYNNERNVYGVRVKDCTIKDADNGLRIKTWASEIPVTVSGIIYENILMNNVQNPIIIDQYYCLRPPCDRSVSINSYSHIFK